MLFIFQNETINGQTPKIKDFLLSKDFSLRYIKKASKERRLFVNNTSVYMDYLLQTGDELRIEERKLIEPIFEAEEMDLVIIYEDEEVLVLDKPPFLLVHPTSNHPHHTLANGVAAYFQKQHLQQPVRLVSRLDRDTSGLILIAKSSLAHSRLSKSMEEGLILKKYLALVEGEIAPRSGTLDFPIGQDPLLPIRRCVIQGGQPSITHYQTLDSYPAAYGKTAFSLVELQLETGRTHQIRVHLSHIGHPLLGDTLYNPHQEPKLENPIILRQALQAYSLSFPHPINGERILLEIDLAADLKSLLPRA